MSKYHNVRTNGYASRKEAARAADLELLERDGRIRLLSKQVRYTLLPATPEYPRPLRYYADFTYWDNEKNCVVVEDVKGMKTQVYKLKKRMMRQLLNVTITEV